MAQTYDPGWMVVSAMKRLCTALMVAGVSGAAISFARAQLPLPATQPPEGGKLFKQQCATCHTTSLDDPQRQGPNLVNIVGRPAGKMAGFAYSPGFAGANFAWDETRLDAWLTNPQDVIPGAVMPYRQAKPEIRGALIAYLKELH
jgi:cytochrome c